VEAVAETDDDLIAKYLEGEELGEEEVLGALHRAVAQGKIYPVVVASAGANKGIRSLLDAIVDMLPSPIERGAVEATELPSGKELNLAPDPAGPLAALVFKTTADPFVGKLTYFRVFSGTLRADSHLWNSRVGKEERVGILYLVRGKSQEPASQVTACDIGAVAKLKESQTGYTLCLRDRRL